jgi:hypothetical protein
MRFRDWPQFWIFVEKLVWDSTRKGGLMMIRQSVNFTIKELRFAIWLPFSAAGEAENGRLSATSLRHAPASFNHAPHHAPLHASGYHFVRANTLGFPKGSLGAPPRLLGEGGGRPKMASSFSTTPAALWPAPSRHGYKYLLPTHPPSNTVSISTQTTPKPSFDLLSCFLLSLASCVRISRTPR